MSKLSCNVSAVLSDGRVIYRVRHERQPSIFLGYWFAWDSEGATQFDSRDLIGNNFKITETEEILDALSDYFQETRQ